MMNKKVNYIVSGLERSGTSLMMQILEVGGIPVAYDDSRKADKSNPKGYYELENGKIIDKLMNKKFPIKDYRGRFIKITSWGLKFLPRGKYDIIYMERKMDEIIESTVRMSKSPTADKKKLKDCLLKFDGNTLDWMNTKESKNFRYITVFYNNLMNESTRRAELCVIKSRFPEFDVDKAMKVIDEKLYHNRSR